jgi:hypothetical protein
MYIQSATSALAPASHNAEINNFCVRTAIKAHNSIPITIKICHTAIPPYRQEMIPNFEFLFVDGFLDSSDK